MATPPGPLVNKPSVGSAGSAGSVGKPGHSDFQEKANRIQAKKTAFRKNVTEFYRRQAKFNRPQETKHRIYPKAGKK